jgi:hypothetical protein
MRDTADDERKVMNILCAHYAGKGKPHIISHIKLISLSKMADDMITDYIIKAETAATGLKNSGQTVSDELLIAMTLKGLSDGYRPFVAMVMQREREL